MASYTIDDYNKALEIVKALRKVTSDKLKTAKNAKPCATSSPRRQLSPSRNLSPTKHSSSNKNQTLNVQPFQSKHPSPTTLLSPSRSERSNVKKKVKKSDVGKPAIEPKSEERLHKTVKMCPKSKFSKAPTFSLLRKCQLKNTKAYLNFLTKSLKKESNGTVSNSTHHFSDRIQLSGEDILRICLDNTTRVKRCGLT